MKLTFEATDVHDLISQVENFLGPQRLLNEAPKLETPTPPPPKFTAVPAAEPAAAPTELPQEKRRPGRPRKEPPPAQENGLEATEEPAAEPIEEPAAEPQKDPFVEPPVDAVALHKLKEETLKRLRDLYLSGKGTFVRELLAKHGHGALVFPEVEAKYFPEIKADMEKGMH